MTEKCFDQFFLLISAHIRSMFPLMLDPPISRRARLCSCTPVRGGSALDGKTGQASVEIHGQAMQVDYKKWASVIKEANIKSE